MCDGSREVIQKKKGGRVEVGGWTRYVRFEPDGEARGKLSGAATTTTQRRKGDVKTVGQPKKISNKCKKMERKKGETNNYMEPEIRCSQSLKQGALAVVLVD